MEKILEEARRKATLLAIQELEKYLSVTPFGTVDYCYALAERILLQNPEMPEKEVLYLLTLDCGSRFESLDELYEAKIQYVPQMWF